MISALQLRAARALLNVDQRNLAKISGLSVPTIQRMETSEGVIRGNVDSLMKIVTALEIAGIELINEGASSMAVGRGVRLRERAEQADAPRSRYPRGPARKSGGRVHTAR
ncbi:MAG: helix-turn-helix transcriptional regulator [Afipia sp.]|nr:helix-turn-helix transcriptional regulator [Afipia sp.]